MLGVYFENCIGYYVRVIFGAFLVLNVMFLPKTKKNKVRVH